MHDNPTPGPEEELPTASQLDGRSTRPALIKRIFIGPAGIRAGWSVVMFFAAIFASAFALSKVVIYLRIAKPSQDATPDMAIAAESIIFLIIASATAIMALIERKSILAYGLKDRRAISRLLIGFGISFGVHIVQTCLLVAGGWLTFTGAHFDGAGIFKAGVLGVAGCLLIGLTEETMFRGYLLHTLARGLKFWWAAAIMSILFGAVHLSNPDYTWVDAVEITASGFMLALSLRISGSLFWAVGFHAAWDWSETYVYGVADGKSTSQIHLLTLQPTAKWAASGTQADSAISMVLMLGMVALGFWLYRPSRKESTEHSASSGLRSHSTDNVGKPVKHEEFAEGP